jgi:hypothetical protein
LLQGDHQAVGEEGHKNVGFDAGFELVESDFGAFRSLSATFCVAMTLAVGVAERRAG